MRAVALLSAFKFRNALRTLFSDPRKLAPFVLLILIVSAMIFLGNMGINQPHPGSSPNELNPRGFAMGVTISLILLGLSFIDAGLGDTLLAFGMPDVDYLFPSPISRRVVLLYRLPALMFSAMFMAGFVLMALSLTMQAAHPKWIHPGNTIAPGWAAPAALFLSGGIYMNLAMFISVSVNQRNLIHKALMGAIFVAGGALGLLGWQRGFVAVETVMESRWVFWGFLPSSLASQSLVAGFSHQPSLGPLGWLAIGYVISLVPMFSSNANWYEQSIVSTEKTTAFRQAARGGYAALASAKATSYKQRRNRTYTISPFGQGAGALFWAHLCAAAKKPMGNFIGPLAGGIGTGFFGAFATAANAETENIGFAALLGIGLYCSMGFLASAKAACEAAIRRRELLSPLPIAGWKTVVANLGVPICTILLFFGGCGISYAAMRSPSWQLVAFAFCLCLPLRLIARMVLQYIIGIAYPDIADKIQQFFAVGVYGIATTPFLCIEAILCIPGMVLHSLWGVFIAITLFQLPLTAFLLFLAGKATEKAVATGEPVRLLSLIKRSD